MREEQDETAKEGRGWPDYLGGVPPPLGPHQEKVYEGMSTVFEVRRHAWHVVLELEREEGPADTFVFGPQSAARIGLGLLRASADAHAELPHVDERQEGEQS